MASLTADQIEFIEEYYRRGEEIFGVNSYNAYQIAIVLAGLRRGCHFSIGDDDFKSWLDSALEEYDIPHQIESKSVNDHYHIAVSESWLQKHDFSDIEEFGRFLDYPEDAIQTYLERPQHLDDYYDFITKTEFPREVFGDFWFVRYIPALSEDAVREAIRFENECRTFLRDSSLDTSGINIEPVYTNLI